MACELRRTSLPPRWVNKDFEGALSRSSSVSRITLPHTRGMAQSPPDHGTMPSTEGGHEGLRLVYHVGGKHLCGDGPDVPRVVDDARRDHEWVAGTKCKGRPVVELHRYVASHDVPNFGTTCMTVPAGGDTLGDFGKGLDYLPPGDRRWEALQLCSLERG